MNIQLLGDYFEKYGVTEADLEPLARSIVVQREIKDIDLALEQIGAKMDEATYSIRQEQEALRVKRAALVASLAPKP